jgi:hypothetical protein
MGENCMNCHQAKGPGKGKYTVAGTIYDEERKPVPNGRMELWDGKGPAAKLVLAVDGDSLGNFYSTQALPFPNQSLFVSVQSADGSKRNDMPFPTISGACNQCHVRGNLVDVKTPTTPK